MLCHKFARLFTEKKASQKSERQDVAEMIKYELICVGVGREKLPVYDDLVLRRKMICWIIIV